MADSTNIISRLATKFSNSVIDRDKPDFLTRDIGGQFRTNQPYLSGYFQVVFGLPMALFGGPDQVATASKWLHSTCESFTPHSQTLNKTDIMGQGQIGSSFVTGVATSREFTLAFREYQNQVILNIFRRWGAIFDPFVGVSPLRGNDFIPANYKGWCAVIQTKPVKAQNEPLDEGDFEECYVYQGVWPVSIPVDTVGSTDISASDTIQESVTFSFDSSPLTSAEPGVLDTCISLLRDLAYMGISDSTYDRYLTHATTVTPWNSNGATVNSSIRP